MCAHSIQRPYTQTHANIQHNQFIVLRWILCKMHWIFQFSVCHWYTFVAQTVQERYCVRVGRLMVKCYARICIILSIVHWQPNVAGCVIHSFGWPFISLAKIVYCYFSWLCAIVCWSSAFSFSRWLMFCFTISPEMPWTRTALQYTLREGWRMPLPIQIHTYVSLLFFSSKCHDFRQQLCCMAQCDNCVYINIGILRFFPPGTHDLSLEFLPGKLW